MEHIVFVCTGNICRSPMAEGLFRSEISGDPDFSVSSAGTGAPDGEPPSAHAVEALRQEGIDITGLRSTGLTRDLIDDAAYIFTMTGSHKQAIERSHPSAAEKTFLVCEFCDSSDPLDREIPDPIGMGLDAYLETRDRIKNGLDTEHSTRLEKAWRPQANAR